MTAEDNRKLVQMCYEAFDRGDLQVIYDAVSDDVVWTNHSPETWAYSGVYYGQGGVEQYFLNLDVIKLERFDVRRILAEDDTVVVVLDQRYTVKATGKSAEGPLVHLLTLKDGKIATFDELEHCENSAWA